MRDSRVFKLSAMSAAVASALVTGQPVQAQQTALEEVIVTATRRSESIQDIPINIAAISGDAIEEQGLSSLSEVMQWVPGIHVVDQGSRAADAIIDWMLSQPGNEEVRTLNPVVGETNDGGLNDIRSRPIRPEHVRQALEGARPGPVQEGSVGAGTGTQAFGWKGGIGTSSRVLPDALGSYTVGVLVQSN